MFPTISTSMSPKTIYRSFQESPRNSASMSMAIFLLAVITILQFTMFAVNTGVYPMTGMGDMKTEEVQGIRDTSLRPKQSGIEGSKLQPFNYTNPHIDSWCPFARCHNSPVCTPCQRRFLFIVATGRSGSTTLLKMFNELPNVRLSGENLNEIYFASQLTSNLEGDSHFSSDKWIQQGRFIKPRIDGPFSHNALPIGHMSCPVQNLLNAMNPPEIPEDTFDMEDDSNTILGMKVIRIQRADWKPYKAAKFFIENFPCARFIVNIRSDIEKQVESFHKNFHWDISDDVLKNETEFLKDFHFRLEHRSKMIDMSDWKDDVSVLNEVVDWLGFENCAFNSIKHENKGGYEVDNSTSVNLGQNCIYPHV
jgi:hypothetical protein